MPSITFAHPPLIALSGALIVPTKIVSLKGQGLVAVSRVAEGFRGEAG